MKPDKNKDITDRMVEMLRQHSLPYKEGAWERFKEYEAAKKKKTIIWPYLSGAAAIVLLGVFLFLRQDEPDIKSAPNSAQTEVPIDEDVAEPLDSSPGLIEKEGHTTAVDMGEIVLDETVLATTISSEPEEEGTDIENLQYYAVRRSSENKLEKLIGSRDENHERPVDVLQQSAAVSQQETDPNRKEESKIDEPSGTYDQEDINRSSDWAFKGESGTDIDLKPSLDKWDFSIELAPNINERNQINFGGGLAVAYNINEKLSISSGVSYVQLDAQRGPNQMDIPAEFSKASLNSYNYNKSLNTINTTLVGLDVPVNLKVNLGSQLYASAGVSVFSVLSESRYNIFEEKIAQVASVSAGGEGSRVPAIQTVYSQEASPNTPYEGKNFTGFFNLSLGYKLPVLKNINLSVEPYLKVPVGSLTDQDMNLGNGGLKIVTSF